MQLRIGIHNTQREIILETDLSMDAVTKLIEKAITNDEKLIKLSDNKETVVLIPTHSFAYVEAVGENPRKVGFIS